MQNNKSDETFKQLELFLSNEYEKVIADLGPKNDNSSPMNDKYSHDHANSKRYLRERKNLHYKLYDGQRSYQQVIKEDQNFNDQSPSYFGLSQCAQESNQSSQSIILIDSKSLPIDHIMKKAREEVQKSKKPNRIKRGKKIKKQMNSQKKTKNQSQRKIRTTVSQEKIKILEHLFPYIENKLAYKGTIINLKDIAKIVNLGYSTILHKYRDFRSKGTVQKGLLLKSKDMKRKYNKSLIIETQIKEALKQRSFRTAKQLALYLSQKHKVKINRSIVSRHLNEMQREKKCQYVGDIEDDNYLFDEECNFREHSRSLKQFSRIFFGLKCEGLEFLYMTVIRIYMIGDKLLKQPKNEQLPLRIINLVVTATQSQLLFYYPTSPNKDQPLIQKRHSHQVKYSAFQTLYQQLLQKIDEKRMQIQNIKDKVFIIFPYQNKHKEFLYRKKVMKQLLDQKINVLVVPPRLNQSNTNFIQKWFFKKVFSKIENQQFVDLQVCRQEIMKVMNEEQKSLWSYASDMVSVVRRTE